MNSANTKRARTAMVAALLEQTYHEICQIADTYKEEWRAEDVGLPISQLKQQGWNAAKECASISYTVEERIRKGKMPDLQKLSRAHTHMANMQLTAFVASNRAATTEENKMLTTDNCVRLTTEATIRAARLIDKLWTDTILPASA